MSSIVYLSAIARFIISMRYYEAHVAYLCFSRLAVDVGADMLPVRHHEGLRRELLCGLAVFPGPTLVPDRPPIPSAGETHHRGKLT